MFRPVGCFLFASSIHSVEAAGSIPAPAAPFGGVLLQNPDVSVLPVLSDVRIEQCLRRRFSILLFHSFSKKVCPYLGLDNRSTPTQGNSVNMHVCGGLTHLTKPCPSLRSGL